MRSIKEEVIDIFMRRDGMTREEAIEEINYISDEINCLDYDEVEDFLLYDYGLEMDYIMAFV